MSVLTVEQNGPMVIATLNRPEVKNAINAELHTALTEFFARMALDHVTRCIVLTGAGAAFSAGGDLKWLEVVARDPHERWRSIDEARRLVHNVLNCSIPVIVAVNGPAVGLGSSLASLADIIYMSDASYFADPHVPLGIAAGDGAAIAWPFHMSMLRAKEFLFTGDKIDAVVAERIGLANRVLPLNDLMPAAIALAQRLSKVPAHSLRATKQAMNIHLRRAALGTLEFVSAAESEHFTSEEFRSAINAAGARHR
jgi:enoyl-CoA hydratase